MPDGKAVFEKSNLCNCPTLSPTYLISILGSALGTDPLTLLTVAASLDPGQSHGQLLKHLGEQWNELDVMGAGKNNQASFKMAPLVPMQVD